MFIINEIQGEGNTYQQDRVGKSEKIASDGTPVHLMWVIDGHGSRMGHLRYDLGGLVSQTAHDRLEQLDGDSIQRLHNDVAFGKELYTNIQHEIVAILEAFLISKGWNKLKDADQNDIDVLWSIPGGRVVTLSGGTTLILVASVNKDSVWMGRMYNVGDSLMILNDMVYSQAGIDGLNHKTVLALSHNNTGTVYCSVPGTNCDHPFHTITESDSVISNPIPGLKHGKHQYYISNVRNDIALGVKLIYTPEMFNLNSYLHSFKVVTNLASWSNMGDIQNTAWASEPSYSEVFKIDGPLSLTSDGIGDILKSEGPANSKEKAGWFNYLPEHPMNGYSTDKNCIFKNSWFHATVMKIHDSSDSSTACSPYKDLFYKVAKGTFGVPDNISRVTFIP